jgi:DinB superfamily
VRDLAATREKLAEAQRTFFRAADSVSFGQWNTKPGAEEWSTAEIVAHLVMVERAIIGAADRITQKKPSKVPFFKRFHRPLWLVETRVIRRKTPIPLDPALLGDMETMLAELRDARERTLSFLEETESRDLREYCWPHLFLGMLNVEWFDMIAAHQVRHAKQVKEIVQRLPKVGENSRK